MNSKERIYALLNGQAIDRIPVTPILMAFAARFIGKTYLEYYLNYQVLVDSYLACQKEFNFDMVMAISDPFRETEGYGAVFSYPDNGIPVMKEPLLKTLEDREINSLPVLDPHQASRMKDRLLAVNAFHQIISKDIPILGWVEGPFAEAADLRGVQNLMMDIIDQPEQLESLLKIVLETEKKFAEEQIKAGADIIGVGDAAASLLSPSLYKKYVLPFEQELFSSIHQLGAKVKLHICGNTSGLLPYMAQTGADIIDLDFMVSLKEARHYFGSQVCICGNVDPISVMLEGTPEDVRQASLRCIEDAGMPFILSAGCEIPVATPPENLHALCQAVL
jgi:MtaA/CmuA family methyltransferase